MAITLLVIHRRFPPTRRAIRRIELEGWTARRDGELATGRSAARAADVCDELPPSHSEHLVGAGTGSARERQRFSAGWC